jgi:nucleoside-diphosphate-sugar epimerase
MLMRLLIIGGTQFLGRHVAEAALVAGHELTLFNRGQTNPRLLPQAEHVQGDRDGGLQTLEGRRWDVVVDTCGYVPRVVSQSAELLADAVESYVFISTLSVYPDFATPNQDEDAPLAALDDPSVEVVDEKTYGGLKVLCEQVVEETLPGRTLVIRPGLIVGPHDPTGRFTYWVTRVAQGGDVLAPAPSEQPIQVIDVRDLGEWTVRLAEQRGTGVYNATGPAEPMTLGGFLDTCREVAASDATFVWADEKYLLEQKVEPFSDLPLWVPAEMSGFHRHSIARAIDAGLTFRPTADTVRATLDWATRVGDEHKGKTAVELPPSGLSPERERELLDGWKASVGTT